MHGKRRIIFGTDQNLGLPVSIRVRSLKRGDRVISKPFGPFGRAVGRERVHKPSFGTGKHVQLSIALQIGHGNCRNPRAAIPHIQQTAPPAFFTGIPFQNNQL